MGIVSTSSGEPQRCQTIYYIHLLGPPPPVPPLVSWDWGGVLGDLVLTTQISSGSRWESDSHSVRGT